MIDYQNCYFCNGFVFVEEFYSNESPFQSIILTYLEYFLFSTYFYSTSLKNYPLFISIIYLHYYQFDRCFLHIYACYKISLLALFSLIFIHWAVEPTLNTFFVNDWLILPLYSLKISLFASSI